MKITAIDFAKLLFNQRGATFVTIVAQTVPTLVGGKKCPLAGLTKTSRVNGTINWSYENAVNRQREREQTPLDVNDEVEQFEAKPRQWGVRLHIAGDRKTRLLPLVAHPWHKSTIDADELRLIPVESLYLEFRVGESLEYQYNLGDRIVPESEVNQYLPVRREGARQQVENPVILRDYKLVNIVEITMNGETYEIEG